MDESRKRRIVMALSAVGCITLLAVMAVALCSGIYGRDVPFDSAAWKNDPSRRPRMVRSLLARDLQGATRAEIDTMLGVPSGRDSARPDLYIYWAGTDGVIDDMWLELQFVDDRVNAVSYGPD